MQLDSLIYISYAIRNHFALAALRRSRGLLVMVGERLCDDERAWQGGCTVWVCYICLVDVSCFIESSYITFSAGADVLHAGSTLQ